MTKQKKIKCPYCGSEHIAEYLRGLPVFDEELQKAVENGEVIIAGCLVHPDDPDYRCRDCHKDFSENSKKLPTDRTE